MLETPRTYRSWASRGYITSLAHLKKIVNIEGSYDKKNVWVLFKRSPLRYAECLDMYIITYKFLDKTMNCYENWFSGLNFTPFFFREVPKFAPSLICKPEVLKESWDRPLIWKWLNPDRSRLIIDFAKISWIRHAMEATKPKRKHKRRSKDAATKSASAGKESEASKGL